MTINETPALIDTRRSWGAARRLLVVTFSFLAAALGFFFGYSDANRRNSDSEIAEFEGSLREYIRNANDARMHRLNLLPNDVYSWDVPFAPGLKRERLQNAVNVLVYDNRDGARARINQAIAEYNYSQSANPADLAVHSEASRRALREPWQRRGDSEAIQNGVTYGAIAAVGAWTVSSILLFFLAFLWWFFMDRLRDVSRALKG